MSREVALKNICLEPCDRWGHTEYSLEYHPAGQPDTAGAAPSGNRRMCPKI